MSSSSSSPSSSNYITSDNGDDDNRSNTPSQHVSTPANRHRPRSSQAPRSQSRQSHQTEFRPGAHDAALQRPLSQPRQLLHQPDSVVQPGQRQSSKGKSGQGKSRKVQSRKSWGVEPRSAKRKEVIYRDVLNSVITDVVAGDVGDDRFGLLDSQIGASFWTAREKDCLFRQSSRTGHGNLPALRFAVRTKSESELRVYLQLLEHESKKQSFTPKSGLDLIDAPAAVEISEACERALDESATSLAALVNERDVALQQTEFDENWLVDEEAAYYIDLAFDQQDVSAGTKDEDLAEEQKIGKVETGEPVQVEGEGEEDDEPAIAKAESEFQSQKQLPSEFNSPIVSIQDSDASITLLRPSSFLQLSRSVFMNSAADPSSNYQLATDLLSEPVDSPAIFRGAFEDFHNLTVSLTRRLVRATLFQAMTRLRSWDSTTGRGSWTPLAAVREVDVRAALDVLSMRPDSKQFWAKAARRNGVEVFSESKKFLDGRPTTKNGVKLTYTEVEAEMGLEKGRTESIGEDESDDFEPESEDFTEMETEVESVDDKHIKQDESSNRPRKRKRAPSPSTYLRAERRYLDALDHNASVVEEAHLWKVLRVQPPDGIDLKHVEVPERPEHVVLGNDEWSDKVQYEAEWENACGVVEHETFEQMGERGVRRCQARQRARSAFVDGDEEEEVVGEEQVEALHDASEENSDAGARDEVQVDDG